MKVKFPRPKRHDATASTATDADATVTATAAPDARFDSLGGYSLPRRVLAGLLGVDLASESPNSPAQSPAHERLPPGDSEAETAPASRVPHIRAVTGRHTFSVPPDTARSDLALTLNTLSRRLAEVGRLEDALSRVEEATQIHRELAQTRPELFLPNLAVTLNNLADRLADLGRHEAGGAALEEATRIYEHLARDRPGMFLADLALTLNRLSDRLAALGRQEEALAVVSRAAEIQRALMGRDARQRFAATAAPAEAADSDYVAGTLQWFNSEKGYGLLAVDNGSDRFVHYSVIDTDNYRSLQAGQRVAVRVAAVPAEASGSASVRRQESAAVSIDDDFRETVESLRAVQSAAGSRLSGRFGYAARRWRGSAAQTNRSAEPGSAPRYVFVAVVIDGQPGELARLFADAGRAGVKIEDIRIETPSGQQEGLAQLMVETSAAAGLAAALAERGWSIST